VPPLLCFSGHPVSVRTDRWEGLGLLFDTYANARHSVRLSNFRPRRHAHTQHSTPSPRSSPS
jgi:hypothetical protein